MLRVPVQSVRVIRDGKSVEPTIGEPFDFTEDEVAGIEKANPDAITSEGTVDLSKEDKKSKAKKDDKKDEI